MLLSGLAAPPAPAQEAAPAEPVPIAPLPPLPAEDRVPVPAPAPMNGIENPEEVAVDFGQGTTPSQLISDEIPRPAEDASQMDVYAPAPKVGDHLAVVSADVLNEQDPSGTWQDVSLELTQDDYGWGFTGPDYSVSFPSALGAGTPIVYRIPEGEIRIVPSGIAAAPGATEGAAVRYDLAAVATDYVYALASSGYKETVVLRDPSADPSLSWELRTTGLTLRSEPNGIIAVFSGTTQVATMPAPVAIDSSEVPKLSAGDFTLTDQGQGGYLLSAAFSPTWLAAAAYPVQIDPGSTQPGPLADTYVNGTTGNQDTSYGGATSIRTGPSNNYRSFVKFPTTWQQSGRLIYSAEFWVRNLSENTDGSDVTVKRVDSGWTQGATWNTKPGVSDWLANPKTFNGATGSWWSVELKSLYQRFNDGLDTDRGVELSSPDNKTFSSSEGSSPPYLLVSYNDLPATANLDGPDTGTYVDTLSPTLRVDRIPADPNGDDVLIRYQVTDSDPGTDPDAWTSPAHVHSSDWTDEKSFVVPSSWLLDGVKVWWRVQARDICTQPDTLCSLTDGRGNDAQAPASQVRTLTPSLKHWGDDSRYQMWGASIGNAMDLKVNESNGNLYLHVPLDALRTPLGRLRLGLSYNHQSSADKGMGPGWRLYAGPESGAGQLPTKLTKQDPWPWAGVSIRFKNGSEQTFPYRAERTWVGVGAGAGTVRQNDDGTFRFSTPSGDLYLFDSEGNLDKARPAYTKDKATQGYYRYTVNSSGHVTKVTDPIDREVTFTWTAISGGERLTRVTTWDARHWDLTYDSSQRLQTITTPQDETLTYTYSGADRMIEVKDGKQTYSSTTGWRIGYMQDSKGNWRVESLTPPGAAQVAPGTAGNYWYFQYSGPFHESTASTAIVTDPRGMVSALEGDYQSQVDFNWAGFPTRIAGPVASGSEDRAIATQIFDSNNNLLCSRSAAANALRDAGCDASDQNDRLNTRYQYENRAPFRPASITYPAWQDVAGTPRRRITYRYDDGQSFQGLWAELYSNQSLAGVPEEERIWTDFHQDWGTGSPQGISGGDYFSIRLTGRLDIDNTQAKTYQFRVHSDDGVLLIVGSDVLLSCFGLSNSQDNCGNTNDPKKKLWPGTVPITLEYEEKTGSAKLWIEWKEGNGGWQTLQAADTLPDIGVRTDEYVQADSGAQGGLELHTSFAYPTDDAKARRLATSKTVEDAANPADHRRTEFTYDDYGRKTEIVRFADQASAYRAVTARTFTDSASQQKSCLTRVVDPSGAQTDYVCDQAGDVTSTTITIGEVRDSSGNVIQASETRTSSSTYDAMGRPISVDPAGPGITTYDYDRAGRTKQQAVLLDDMGTTQTSDDVRAITTYGFGDFDAPAGANRTTTETLPDPDGTGPLLPASVTHTFDWAGNEISRTDPRPGIGTWQTGYDAQNRVLSSTTPSGLETKTAYELSPENSVTVTDPALVWSKTVFDVLARKSTEQREGVQATSYSYDWANNATMVVGPGGVWVKNTYNAFGQVSQKIEPVPGGGTSTGVSTYYYYDPAGRLQTVQGPLSGSQLDYSYDKSGRLKTVTQKTTASSSTTSTITYNDAGERIMMQTPLSGTQTIRRNWTYYTSGLVKDQVEYRSPTSALTSTSTYDDAGRLVQVHDPRPMDVYASYDALGHQICRWSGSTPTTCGANATSEAFTYDQAGNMTQAKNNQDTVDLFYDADGRLDLVSSNAGSTDLVYAADNSQGGAKGSLFQMISSQVGTIQYSYCSTGTATCPLGMLASVDEPFATGASSYAYEDGGGGLSTGRVRTRTDAQTGVVWTRTYEADTGRPDTQSVVRSGSELSYTDLSYDDAGNVATRTQRVGGSPSGTQATWTYGYDLAGRMTDASGYAMSSGGSYSAKSYSFAYDGMGNRTSVTEDGSAITTTFDDAGNPVSSSDGTTYQVDGAGELTGIDRPGSSNDWSYTFDAFGRATQAAGSSSITYKYDALNRTYKRKVGTQTTTNLYWGTSEDLAKQTQGTNWTAYAYSPGGPLAQMGSDQIVRFYLKDLHGDIVGAVSASGTIDAKQYFSPYGERTASGTGLSLGFQGDFTDPSTGQVDMLTRWYEPSLGRFSTRDVLFGDPADPVSLNQYAYGGGSPVTYTDPSGMTRCDADPDLCSYVEENGGWGDNGNDTVVSTGYALDIIKKYVDDPESISEDALRLVLERFQDDPQGLVDIISNYAENAAGPTSQLDDIVHNPVGVWVTGYHATPTWVKVADGAAIAVSGGFVLAYYAGVPVVVAAGDRCIAFCEDGADAANKIAFGANELSHVIERHTAFGTQASGKSVFLPGTDLPGLIDRASTAVTPLVQRGGNLQYVLNAPNVVGVDRLTGLQTSLYTVITSPDGTLVTMFPGLPTM